VKAVFDRITDPANRGRLVAALVALVAAVVYANSVGNGFAYDDDWIVRMNARVHDLGNQRDIWLAPYWPNYGAMLGLHRPLTIFLFAVQWAISGGEPWLFHLVNVLLHAGVSVAVLALLRSFVPLPAAAVGALVFAVHPVHTEAVANVVGQAELTAALAVLLASIVWVRRPAGPLPAGRTLALAALYGLGMLAKEHAIVLPGLLLALDVATHRLRFDRASMSLWLREALRPMAWMFAVSIAFLTLRLNVLGSIGGTDAGPSLPYLREELRVLSAFRAWVEFTRLLFLPLDLAADYGPAVVLPVQDLGGLALLGMLLLIGTVVLALATPRLPMIGVAAAWFLISILPVSNLLFPIGVLLAERTLYMPSVAVAFIAAAAWHRFVPALRTRRPRAVPLAWAVLALLLIVAGARTARRNLDWADSWTVMTALMRDHPESYRAQWAMAVRAMQAGRAEEADQHWQMAYAMWNRDAQMLAEYGVYEMSRGRNRSAVHLLERSDSMMPDHPRTVIMRALALRRAGMTEQALQATREAFRVMGPDPRVFEFRASVLADLGRHAEAAGAWRAVIANLPEGGGTAEQYRLLADQLEAAGFPDRAAAARDTAALRE